MYNTNTYNLWNGYFECFKSELMCHYCNMILVFFNFKKGILFVKLCTLDIVIGERKKKKWVNSYSQNWCLFQYSSLYQYLQRKYIHKKLCLFLDNCFWPEFLAQFIFCRCLFSLIFSIVVLFTQRIFTAGSHWNKLFHSHLVLTRWITAI